jgi:hypothetical protein
LHHARTGKPPNGHSSLIALAAVTCAVAIAACGSSSRSVSGAGSSGAARGIRFADCMRTNGVPNFPDPGAGGGVQIQAGSGINPFSPSFKAAQTRCAKLLPGGGPRLAHPSESRMTQMLALSECMRRHGVAGFPDPTLTPPSSPAGYSLLQDSDGVVLAVPDTINPGSPTFKEAAAACQFGG